MNKAIIGAAVAAGAAFLFVKVSSKATAAQRITADVTNVRLKNVSIATTDLAVQFTITNPTGQAMHIDWIEATIYSNNQQVGTAKPTININLPAFDAVKIEVPLQISNIGVSQLVFKYLQGLIFGKPTELKREITVKGTVGIAGGITLPFTQTQTI